MSTAQALGALSAFRACRPADLDAFVGVAPTVRFPRDTVVISQGDTARDAYLLVSGRCRAEIQGGDRRMLVGRIGPGEVIGELGLFTAEAFRSATVVAEEDVHALLLAHDILDNPRARAVISVIEQRALSTLAERVRHNTGSVRRCDEQVDDDPSASFVSGMMGALRKLWGG